MEIYKPHEFAKLLGVSVKTLQRWDTDGVLFAFRNPKNMRYYTHQQYLDYYNIKEETDSRKNIIYSRVSTKNQADDLKNQITFIESYCKTNNIIPNEVLFDYGSGLNYNRKNWNNILKQVMKSEVKSIIISHKDRFVRFGFDWFERMCEFFGTKIIVINQESSSPQKELVRDIISILHVFSCKLYGLRKYKSKIVQDNEIRKVL